LQTDDRILPITRIVAVIVVPFLWLAFLILFFTPDLSGERFAWAIKPHMTAMYLGAGYLGGSWLLSMPSLANAGTISPADSCPSLLSRGS